MRMCGRVLRTTACGTQSCHTVARVRGVMHMAAVILRHRTRRVVLRAAEAEELRRLVGERPDLPERLRSGLIAAIDRETASPPAYSSLRHRLAVRESRGGGGWTTRSGWARARRSAPHTLAEAGPRPRHGGACRRAASGRRSCGCCAARTWSWSRAGSG